MEIRKNITSINKTTHNGPRKIIFLVIHYFGDLGTAKNNADFFKNIFRGASAHYFVDETSIWQVVEDNDISWHVGDKGLGEYTGICTNANSISIELRPNKLDKINKYAADQDWYFEKQTLNNAKWLILKLMKTYNIPYENVIRHYDVTGKWCPRPFVGNDYNKYYEKKGNQLWIDFKNFLKERDEEMTQEQFNAMMDEYLKERAVQKPSSWSEDFRTWAETEELILGDGKGNMAYMSFVTREQLMVFFYNFFKAFIDV